jgi:tetratricopeptide (TPR) repeat protein
MTGRKPPPPKDNRERDERERERDPVADLLKKASQARGGPAAEALRKAAQLTRERGDLAAAIDLYERAAQTAENGPAEPRLRAAIDLELGGLYEAELGRIDQAMSRYERAFKVDPNNAQAIEAGRRIYGSLGDWQMVARLYEVEIETAGNRERRGELLVALGRLLGSKLHDYGQAAVRLEEAVRLRPQDDAAKEALADLYISPDFPVAPGDDDTAQLSRAAELFMSLADARAHKGDHEGQIAFLRRALGADPFLIGAATRLEHAYSEAGRTEELRKLYRQGAPVPQRAVKLCQLAIDAGDIDEAIAACLSAQAEGDDASLAIERLEELLVGKKRFAELADLRERLIGDLSGRDRADLLVDIAGHYQQAGDLARYESSLLEALAAEPVHAEAYRLLSEHLNAKRDFSTLLGIAEQAIEHAPLADQARRLAELAELYEKKLGDVGMAADAWRRAEALAPSPRGAAELKRLWAKQERWASMTTLLDRELEQARGGNERAEVLKRLAQVHRERHDFERARTLYREALELKPDDAAIYRSLAELSEREGRLDQVAEILRKQLRASREKVEKLNLLRRLAVLYDEKLNDLDGIEWACGEILEQLPGDRDALKRLTAAYERAGQAAEPRLIEILESHAQAAATPAEKIPLLHRLAALYEKRDEREAATERLERLLKLDKNDARAQEALGRLYEEQQRWADAALVLDRALGRAPAGAEGVEPWKRFARIVDGKLNDATRSLRAWREVLERRPSDKEALEALTRLARARNDYPLLAEMLDRRLDHADDAEAVTLALERASLLDERLKDPAAAIALLRHVLTELDPRNLAAHAQLGRLYSAVGDHDGSLRIAERELFLCDNAERRLAIAIGIAHRWQDELQNPRRAITAWRRVTELEPAHRQALAALAGLYGQIGAFAELGEVDEQRLTIAEANGLDQEAVSILYELAINSEQQLGDPGRAFVYLRRAFELVGEGTSSGRSGAGQSQKQPQTISREDTLAEMRRVAEQHNLWEEMCAVYATLPGLESRFLVAEIADEKMKNPKRAFMVLRGSLDLDPKGERILPELERLSLRAADPNGLLEVYEQLIARSPTAEKVGLLRRRAELRESRLKDPGGAVDELLRAFPLAPDDAPLLAEIHRLAEVTRRWEDVLAVEGYRFHRAEGDKRLQIACDAAALVEAKVKDPLRALRAYLRAFQLAPEDTTIRDHLWRLARQVGTIEREPPVPKASVRLAAPPPTPLKAAPGVIVSSSRPARDPTLELTLDDAVLDESRPISLMPSREPTVELSINDLVSMAGRPNRPATMELSLSDISLFPARKNGMPPKPRNAPPPPSPLPTINGVHSAWDEIELVQLGLPAADEQARFRHLLAVSEMWEKGAGDLHRAFAALAGAFKLDPSSHEARQALERLAESNQAWDLLVAVLDDAIEETTEADIAVQLLLDSARVRERQGEVGDAEARYHRALGMRPEAEEALTRLEQIYRQGERWQELATLLERRLHGLLERLPTGDTRQQRAIELADVYERLGNHYEAIDAWSNVAREFPDHAPAFANLARLYERVGQWSKVIESLTRELDIHDVTDEAGAARARDIRKRIGEIFERELELPERAIEAYEAVLDGDPRDQTATEALERLYEKLGRHRQLEELLRQKSDRLSASDKGERPALLRRRAQLLAERLGDHTAAAAVLRQLLMLAPDDDQVAAELGRALGKNGEFAEAAELLRTRLHAQERKRAPAERLARLHVELGTLEAQLGDAAAAAKSLERALQLKPDAPEALAELARLRHGGADWDGYAKARERAAELATTPAEAVAALVDAARVHIEERKDDAAAERLLDRALERDPDAVVAIALRGSLARRQGDDATADQLAERELAMTGERAPAPSRRAELYVGLGGAALRRADPESATRLFRDAIGAQPGYPSAIQGLADLAAQAGDWDEVDALLRDAASREGVPVTVAAQLYRRLAEANTAQGRLDDAYTALLEADKLAPGDLQTRLSLGENRYRSNRYREAAQQLSAIADHPEASRLPEEVGEAVYHGALAEMKLRRPDRAQALLEAAVRIHPGHEAALGLLAERALESGDAQKGLQLLEQQALATRDPAERALRLERVADALVADLGQAERAVLLYDQAIAAAGDGASTALLDKALELSRSSGQLQAAAAIAARLLERASKPNERAKRLRETAALDAALGLTEQARHRLQAALELDPLSHETLAGLSAMLVQEGRDDDAAQLLTRALPMLPPPDESLRAPRAALWTRLAETRERLRDHKGALTALERALEADPSQQPLRQMVLERYGDDPAYDQTARTQHRLLLTAEPLHVPSLRALGRIEARADAFDRGRRYLELLAVTGAISDEERQRLASITPADQTDPQGTLDENDHVLLAHPDARALAEVFAALWEGTAQERAPGLDSLGVRPEDRVSPVAQGLLPQAYSLVSRMLGNRKTGLYLKPDPRFAHVALVAQPPTAVVVGPPVAEGRSPAEVRFLLGRALEIARPEYVLAAALPSPEFTRLFAAILRAFHPRQQRRRPNQGELDEAAMWKRALPYKVAKRLAELFRELADTEFSSVRWRRGVEKTGNRAGLLAAGEITAAARVLAAEGDSEGLEDLARFAASDDYPALRRKLDGALGRR